MSKPSLGFLKRKPQSQRPTKAGLRQRLATWVIPFGIAAGLLALLAVLFGERLLPARAVQLATVVTLEASESTDENTLAASPENPAPTAAAHFTGPVAFQASGWIEAYPQAVKATALVTGVVDEVFALEGQSVKKGSVIATLVDEDARLDLLTAQAQRSAAEARLAANQSAQTAQSARVEALRQQLSAARARLVFLEADALSKSDLGKSAVSELDILETQQNATAQRSIVAALLSQIDEAEAETKRLEHVSKQQAAALSAARTELARCQLALDRTQITAPISGRIMKLHAAPGQQRMLGADNPESAAIAHLYDPQRLQARIDIPLSEASALTLGQAVRLRSNFLPDQTFRGRVIRIDGQADLQRNTLQAKVQLIDNDERLRPEMLCRAEFLAPATGAQNTAGERAQGLSRVRIFVPEAALEGVNRSQASAWVVDPSRKRISKRQVELGDERRDEYRLVESGLRPGDRVVLDPEPDLAEGQRIKPADSP